MENGKHPLVGVLAIQGDYAAHARALIDSGAEPVMIRTAEELVGLDGLIIPGGESTTMLRFLERDGFLGELKKFVETKPAFGTCAGCILLAKEVLHPAQPSLSVLDAAVERNAYGRQIDSTILSAETSLPGGPLEMVFIRAPRMTKVGDDVEVLADREGFPVLVRQGHLMAATFHPELSADRRVHQLFVDIVKRNLNGRRSSQPVEEAVYTELDVRTQ
ncbi:pyridoxal 5'-phosphate synthase glutaminase subunit PdxT [Acidisarcina polymorpha]|uniref:pyridoxal 5'-phosphate synthase glutaminase subunit PdxT n=1 Tax=Acidisarcina polymorpha TaxID=2211140 RepID=UPI000DEFBEAC|nr:pyridoxal 5'-phosphate synthase glutaminase subunit PdxT [Acidisarcina polymorpha]